MRPVRLDKLARGAGARTMLPAAVQVSPRVVAVHEHLGFEAEVRRLTDHHTRPVSRLRHGSGHSGRRLPATTARAPDEALYYPIDGHLTALVQEGAAEALAAAIARG